MLNFTMKLAEKSFCFLPDNWSKYKKYEKIVVFMKSMKKEVKNVGSPLDVKL